MSASRGNATASDHGHPAAFAALSLVALIVCALGLYMGRAPILSPYPEDWIGWARTTLTWSGVFALGLALLLLGLIGLIRSLLVGKTKAVSAVSPYLAYRQSSSIDALAVPATASPALPVTAPDIDAIGEPAAAVGAHQPMTTDMAALGVSSLEPTVFHDNASDSFMSHRFNAAAPAAVEAETSGAQIIPLRPASEPQAAADESAPVTNAPETNVPETNVTLPADSGVDEDVFAGLFLADDDMRLADEPFRPAMAIHPVEDEAATEAPPQAEARPALEHLDDAVLPVEPAPAPAAQIEAAPQVIPDAELPHAGHPDAEAEVRQAVQMALSVWPDATRAIAADELSVRLSQLYHDTAPDSARAFRLIAGGDLSATASVLQRHAEALAQSGQAPRAAEVWRVIGALNMGRDDARAMAAYERVSDLDAADGNIHLYLARRYQMAGDSARQANMISRALYVISDPDTRVELLTPYAEHLLKAGQLRAGGEALDELARLQENAVRLRPDDMGTRSAYAVTMARLGQVRELEGLPDQAAPLYRHAHRLFSDLSARKPDHAGLRAMAAKAQADLQRLGVN